MIARVRNTANSAISSFNYLLGSKSCAMCIFSISLKNAGNCVEDAGVTDRSVVYLGFESNGTETGLTAYRFAHDSLR